VGLSGCLGLHCKLTISPHDLVRHLSLRYNKMPFMKLSDLVKEHKALIPVLRSGTVAQRKKEAKKQAKELRKYVK